MTPHSVNETPRFVCQDRKETDPDDVGCFFSEFFASTREAGADTMSVLRARVLIPYTPNPIAP